MPQKTVNVDRIKQNIEDHVECGQNNVEKGNLFAKWTMKYVFEQTENELEEMVAIGGKDDNSIDAYFEENKTLYLVQTKYKTSHSGPAIAGFIADIKRLLESPEAVIGVNPLVHEAAEKIKQYREDDKMIEIYYITNAEFTANIKDKVDREVESFTGTYENISLYIWDINCIKDYFDMELDVIPRKYQGKSAQIILKKHFTSNITCVAEVELKHFATFVKINKDYLFYSNLRNYLKSTPVNKGIVDTFHNNPTDFWYFNNGITLVCDDFKIENDHFLSMITPQIVNGCQTANTILKEFISLKDADKQRNLQGTILIKVIKDKNKIKKDQITQYTNRQNAVTGKDFFALDKFQRHLSREFEQLGYFYEIQNKSSLVMNQRDMLRYKGIDTYKYLLGDRFENILPVKVVVQTYAAGMHFLPGTAASRSGELMVYGKKWSMLFHDNTPEDPYYWLFPFAVMVYAKNNLGYNNKSDIPYKRNSLMFFVSCYYRALCYFLFKISVLNLNEGVNPLNVPTEIYMSLFYSKTVNIKFLNVIDNIVKFFMKDGLIKDVIKQKYGREDLANFMKSEIETNEKVRNRLDEIIQDFINEEPVLVKDIAQLYGIIMP